MDAYTLIILACCVYEDKLSIRCFALWIVREKGEIGNFHFVINKWFCPPKETKKVNNYILFYPFFRAIFLRIYELMMICFVSDSVSGTLATGLRCWSTTASPPTKAASSTCTQRIHQSSGLHFWRRHTQSECIARGWLLDYSNQPFGGLPFKTCWIWWVMTPRSVLF